MRRILGAMTGITLGVLLALPVAATDEREPIVVQDPHYGDVLFHFFKEDYFAAIVRLLALRETSKLESHLTESEVLLGGLYLNYGHHLEAAEIFEHLLADNVDPEIRDRTWFFLAKIWQQRGYFERSAAALASIEGTLPDNLEREARMLEAELFISSGQYDRAISLLSEWQGETEWSRYAKFNLGVALVRSGRIDEAERILDELGNIEPWNEELTSLRDKANLALGYALLQDEQPLAAKAPLSRVRLEGPFSNKALLGIGWADAQLENYQRALVPWMELRGRDLLDSAVQESMLAIPFALGKLDAVSQAADHYLNAIEAFYEETNRLDAAIGRIESGEFFDGFVTETPLDSSGWYWELEQLPEGSEARYLYHLLSTHEFQEGFKNYRDLKYLHQNLDGWQRNVDVFQNMLDTRREAFETRLPWAYDALGRANIDELVDRKLDYDSVLNDIERSGDWLALANEEQFAMWGEITGLEGHPALDADTPDAADVRNKIRLMKGVLQWELERDFKDKLWRLRRELRQTGEALVETQRSRREVDQSMADEPLDFEALGTRVDGLASRIDGMMIRVDDALAAQRAYLQQIAVGELTAQKQRLNTYSVQARFALSSIYDRAATVSEAAE